MSSNLKLSFWSVCVRIEIVLFHPICESVFPCLYECCQSISGCACVCVCVCVSVLFTLTDPVIECSLAVTGRRPSLALSHRCPCTLSSCCQGPSDSGGNIDHTANQSQTYPQPPALHVHTHPPVRSLSVTAVSNGKKYKNSSLLTICPDLSQHMRTV